MNQDMIKTFKKLNDFGKMFCGETAMAITSSKKMQTDKQAGLLFFLVAN